MSAEATGRSLGYGCEVFGRLRRVMLHRPERALERITAANCRRWQFDAPPDVEGFLAEHDRYRALLESLGVEVIELCDCLTDMDALTARLPNLTYMHDIAVVSSHGALLSRMIHARRREDEVVGEALRRLGIPILTEFHDPDDAFEGCLLLSESTVLVADTERHTAATIRKFIPRVLEAFEQVVFVTVPKARRFMHPDTLYNRIDHGLALAYPPAFGRASLWTTWGVEEIDFLPWMRSRGVEIIPVSDVEQRALACSVVPLEPGVVIIYDTSLAPATRRALGRRGVELIFFHPEALLAGGGSLRCLTLRLHREPARRR